eukprot:TRINITY_DN4269_c0_g1_i1.p1 TRINITY_DN4269_c0_g1~~TRINITY_DN4269_c0_g1_i1.p1  ORF type:complete len:354 (-),score=66.30 TRINITY_DN4269_c0_g1_i1:120-1181(-)
MSTRRSARNATKRTAEEEAAVPPTVPEVDTPPAPTKKTKTSAKKDAGPSSSEPSADSSAAAPTEPSTAAPAESSAPSTKSETPKTKPHLPFTYSSSGPFKIISWNVNGIRAAMNDAGFKSFFEKVDADVICIQETKADLDSAPKGLLPKYKEIWNPCKTQKGYSGTLIYTKNDPISTTTVFKYGKKTDQEGRVIVAEYTNFYLINTYIPNSGQKLDRLKERTQEWDPAFLEFMIEMDQKKPIIWTGDLNVSHEEIDIENAKGNKRSAGFTQEERDNFSKVLDAGFVDVFRNRNPSLAKQYTYWSYRMNARARNIGWRLDYYVVSPRLMPHIKDCIIHKDVTGSDHCPIELLLE